MISSKELVDFLNFEYYKLESTDPLGPLPCPPVFYRSPVKCMNNKVTLKKDDKKGLKNVTLKDYLI